MRIHPTDPQGSSSRPVSGAKDKTGYFWNHPVTILYKDPEVMVFDKPAGVLTIANPKEPDRNLVDLVNHQFGGTKGKLFPCHRLDRETSGVIIFARSLEIQHRMMDLFKQHEIMKKYTACIQGRLARKSGEIRIQIMEEGRSKEAWSHYRVLEEKDLFSVIEVQPMTGRTNQIRIQFSHIGHPLIGDRKFSVAKDFAVKFKRTALHASFVQWKSPFSRKMIQVEADLPEDMKKLIERKAGDSHNASI